MSLSGSTLLCSLHVLKSYVAKFCFLVSFAGIVAGGDAPNLQDSKHVTRDRSAEHIRD